MKERSRFFRVSSSGLADLFHYGLLFFLTQGERAWLLQGWTWRISGGNHQARPHRCPSPPANPHQSHCCAKKQWIDTGCVRGRRLHTNRHHLWAHHGIVQAPTGYPASPRHLSIPALRQVRATTYCIYFIITIQQLFRVETQQSPAVCYDYALPNWHAVIASLYHIHFL